MKKLRKKLANIIAPKDGTSETLEQVGSKTESLVEAIKQTEKVTDLMAEEVANCNLAAAELGQMARVAYKDSEKIKDNDPALEVYCEIMQMAEDQKKNLEEMAVQTTSYIRHFQAGKLIAKHKLDELEHCGKILGEGKALISPEELNGLLVDSDKLTKQLTQVGKVYKIRDAMDEIVRSGRKSLKAASLTNYQGSAGVQYARDIINPKEYSPEFQALWSRRMKNGTPAAASGSVVETEVGKGAASA